MAEPALDGDALARLRRIGGDTLLRKMIELYLQLGPARVRAVQEAVAARDADTVERAAHTLKSSAANMGATALEQSAAVLETQAAAGAIDAALAERLETQYHESAAALQRALEELGA